MAKVTYQSIIESKEYLIWKDINRVADEYNINIENYYNFKDLSGLYLEFFMIDYIN